MGYWIYIGPGVDHATVDSDYNVCWHPDNDLAGRHFLHGYDGVMGGDTDSAARPVSPILACDQPAGSRTRQQS